MIFQINAISIPTVLLFCFFLFIANKRTFQKFKTRFPLALGYLYILSFAFWWISPFFPIRWQVNPFQGNSLWIAVLAIFPLWIVPFRFLLRLRWGEVAFGYLLFILAHVVTVIGSLVFIMSYNFQDGLGTVVTGMVTMEGIKNRMAWALRETGVVFLLFLLIFKIFSTREEAGDLMASPLWHFSGWISALVFWNLLWVYEVFLTIPFFLKRYFLIYFLQIFLITILCVPFFRLINRVPISVAGRMAWAIAIANLGGVGFRLMVLFSGAIH
ncbi:MAG: hypothetical protein P1S59_06555 [bacterium]|nr:hypothetical protein [bacterium]